MNNEDWRTRMSEVEDTFRRELVAAIKKYATESEKLCENVPSMDSMAIVRIGSYRKIVSAFRKFAFELFGLDIKQYNGSDQP